MWKKIIFWIFLLLAGFILISERILGNYLEPKVENYLSRLFNMPVAVDGLKVDLFFGNAKASRVVFVNQPHFDQSQPHIRIEGVWAKFRPLALLRRKIKIKKINLHRPFYLIDRINTGPPSTNVKTWYYHMKELAKKKAQEQSGEPGQAKKPAWRLEIDKIDIRDGTFIFQDRRKLEDPRNYVFRQLNGYLNNIKWPTADPKELNEDVRLEGVFGETYPAPFKVEGKSHFVTKKISFDLRGKIEDGNVLEHKGLWEGLSIDITEGRFKLRTHSVCVLENLQSNNEVVLSKMKVKPRINASTDLIFGFPTKAWIKFMEDQESLPLEVFVKGYILDPHFGYPSAFRKAFQEALKKKASSGVKLIASGAEKLAAQTFVETPAKIVDGSLDKLKSIITSDKSDTAAQMEAEASSVTEGGKNG